MVKKVVSRSARWSVAINAAQNAIGDIRNAGELLDSAFSDLRDLQSEYQDWYDNMAENLQSGATGQKLEEITNLDLDGSVEDNSLSDLESIVEAAEGVDLPLGWGRD